VPAIVSATAGVAELYPADLRQHLLTDPRDHHRLAHLLRIWSANIEGARRDFEALSIKFRRRSWQSMADNIIAAGRDVKALDKRPMLT
jgi:hypothetical protein